MTREVANALYRYFEALYDLNRNIIFLCGADIFDSSEQYKKYVEEIIGTIPRLIPYKYYHDAQEYRINADDGLLEFSNEITFLSDDYETILEKHHDVLVKIKKIRNKIEHKMHAPTIVAAGSNSFSLLDVTYEINDEEFDLNIHKFIAVVKDMNAMFSKIQKEIDYFSFTQGKSEHPYYRRLIRYDFCQFNKIYESELLRTIGEMLAPF